MRKENKVELVKDLTQKFKENNIFYLLDASGLTVDQVNNFREKCFKKDVEYKVVKNTFIKKALENVFSKNSSKTDISKTAFEIALKQLI